MPMMYTRRRFVTTLSVTGAAAGFFRAPRVLAAEEALETTTIRLQKNPGVCIAPVYAAEALLRTEGFTDIRYVDLPNPAPSRSPGVSPASTSPIEALARGEIDFALNYATNFVVVIDSGTPITLLAGVHVGCYEVFAREGIRTIADFKGKSVGIHGLGSTGNMLVALMAAQVGLDPDKDIYWVRGEIDFGLNYAINFVSTD